jgi:hypothetical protein
MGRLACREVGRRKTAIEHVSGAPVRYEAILEAYTCHCELCSSTSESVDKV